MTLLFTLALGLIAYFFGQFVRKFFIQTLLILSVLALIPIFKVVPLFEETLVTGYVGLAFYIVVMFAGAFPKSSKISKKLRSVRKEYSIYGFIVLFPHIVIYLMSFLNGSLLWEIFGVIGVVIMIPLFITSFTYIKKKMNIKTWMTLQKYAYLVYLLIFIHLIRVSEPSHAVIYIFLVSAYVSLKAIYYVFEHQYFFKYMTTCIALVIALGYGITYVLSVNADNTEILNTTYYTTISSTTSLIDTTIAESTSNSISTTTTSTSSLSVEGPFKLVDGDYTGYSTGYHGLAVEVVVTLENGYITNIEVVKYGGTSPQRGINFEQAALTTVSNIVLGQTTNVDTVAGATYTTSGIIKAVKDALS
ncbi:MAG: FMN-binding protein [Candidatus Izemoplasmatales bacterium]